MTAFEPFADAPRAAWLAFGGRPILGLLVLIVATAGGCQVDVGGQTLPSAYYLQDDIQYFPSGPEFKLSKEAAALKAYSDEVRDEACEPCGN